MEIKTILGLIAGILTTGAFLPQTIKILKTKETKDLSLLMYVTFCTGVLFWLTYGIFLKDKIIILFNSISLILNLAIIRLKFKYK